MHADYDNVIGVDVASKKLDLHHNEMDKWEVVENSTEQTVRLASRLKRARGRTLVVMEATGGYENKLLDALHEAGLDCAVVNPLRIRQFAKGCGKLEKNDKIDAKVIAEYGAFVKPMLKEELSPMRKRLRSLVHRRDQILGQLSAERNRLQQADDELIRDAIEEAITFYKKQLKSIDARIAETINQCEELSESAQILLSCPGVGVATAAMLLSELPELGQLNRGQIAKLVGVAPLAHDSGTKEGHRKTFAGRALVRKMLYMAALVSTRYNPRLKTVYQSLLSRGKPKKLALVAVMRKLLVTLNTMIKNNQKWREPALAVDKN